MAQKWIAAAGQHGYKAAAEMAAADESMFGYQFSMLIDASLLDSDDPRFPAECKPSDEGGG